TAYRCPCGWWTEASVASRADDLSYGWLQPSPSRHLSSQFRWAPVRKSAAKTATGAPISLDLDQIFLRRNMLHSRPRGWIRGMPRNACWKCPIRDVALCRALPESALAQLSRMTWHRSVRAGCRIFGPGEEPLVVANIVS